MTEQDVKDYQDLIQLMCINLDNMIKLSKFRDACITPLSGLIEAARQDTAEIKYLIRKFNLS